MSASAVDLLAPLSYHSVERRGDDRKVKGKGERGKGKWNRGLNGRNDGKETWA